jgi:hypothetical protein
MITDQKKKFGYIATAIIVGISLVIDLRSQPNNAKVYYYLPYINGVVFTSAGLYFFLFSFGIYKLKYKSYEQRERVEGMLKKRGNSLKFGSIVVLIFGAYNLIVHDPKMYMLNGQIENSKWTDRDKQIFIKSCLKIVEPKLKNHHQIALDYCTCSIDKIMKDMEKKQYVDDLSMPKQTQDDKFEPFYDGCAVNIKRWVDSAEKTGK